MVRLSDIPPDVLEQIQKFVREKKKEVPVTSRPKPDGTRIKTLPDLVEEKFGYKLSPTQIYTLQKGERRYSIKLDVDTIRELEEHFGSASKGIKQMLKFYNKQRIPPHLKAPYQTLLKKGVVSPNEVEKLLLPFVEKESGEAWKIISELARLGYITRDKDGNFVIHKFRRDPMVELLFGFD